MSSKGPNHAKLDQIVAASRKAAEERGHGYREQALKMYPWICGRCGREFTRVNLTELTVHHRNHDQCGPGAPTSRPVGCSSLRRAVGSS